MGTSVALPFVTFIGWKHWVRPLRFSERTVEPQYFRHRLDSLKIGGAFDFRGSFIVYETNHSVLIKVEVLISEGVSIGDCHTRVLCTAEKFDDEL